MRTIHPNKELIVRRLATGLLVPVALLAASIVASGEPATAASSRATATPATAPVPLQGATTPPFRAAPPSEAEQVAARRRLANVLAPVPDGATPEDRVAHAHELMARVHHDTSAPAGDFVLTTAAIDTARDAHDLYLCFRLIDDLALAFDVDTGARKVDAAVRIAAAGTDLRASRFNHEAADELASGLLKAEQYPAAAKAAGAAVTFAVASGEARRAEDARSLLRDVALLWTEAEDLARHRLALAASPEDPTANAAVGKYLAFVQADWDAGLPMMAKGSDRAMAAVAQAYARNPRPPAMELAGLWWDASTVETNPLYRGVERWNAYTLYKEALDLIGPIDRALVALANDRIDQYDRIDGPKVYWVPTDYGVTRRWFVVRPDPGNGWVPLDFHTEAGHTYHVIAQGRWQPSRGEPCGPDGVASAVTVLPRPASAPPARRALSAAHAPRGTLVARVAPVGTIEASDRVPVRQPIEFAVGSDTEFIAPDGGTLDLRMRDDHVGSDGGSTAATAWRGALAVEVVEVRTQLFPPAGAMRIRAMLDSDVTLAIGDDGACWEAAGDRPVVIRPGNPAPPMLCGDVLWLPRWGEGGRSDALIFSVGNFPALVHLASNATRDAAVMLERPDDGHLFARIRPSTPAPFAPADVRFTLTDVAEPATAPVRAVGDVAQSPAATTSPTTTDARAADDACFALAERRAREAEAAMRIGLTRLSTEHALIYTDCEPKDRGVVQATVELRVAAVDREIGSLRLEPRDRGRVPVFVLSRRSELHRTAHDVEGGPELPERAWGYFFPSAAGTGYVVTYRPPSTADASATAKGEADWSFTLTHELTHALVARYHPGRALPSWVDEGLANYVATAVTQKKIPIYEWARVRIGGQGDAAFRDIVTGKRDGRDMQDYAVYQVMVTTLCAIQPNAFPQLIADLKDGVDVEAALQSRYHLRLLDLSSKCADRVEEFAGKDQ